MRKQTTATMRRMHALMAIQVRARVQRVQMAAEEAQLVVKTQSSFHKGFVPESGVRAVHRDRVSLIYSAFFLQIHGVLSYYLFKMENDRMRVVFPCLGSSCLLGIQ